MTTREPESELEAALRASLAERSRFAPADGLVVDAVMDTVQRPALPHREPRQWGAGYLPLIAAAAVAVVVGSVIGVTQLHHTPHSATPAAPGSTAPATTPDVPAPTTGGALPPIAAKVIGAKHFSVYDLTFVGDLEGWALGSADCSASATTCTSIIHTTDGGATWRAIKAPPVHIPLLTCAEPCVHNLRFATSAIGYAYGPNALYFTLDGGATWHPQPGAGADALETLGNDVIRVSTACSPGCPYVVQTSDLGSTKWTTATLPGTQAAENSGVSLTRTGTSAYLDVFGHVAGGAENATSVLFSSADDGHTWTRRGEPCPQDGAIEVDSTLLTSAPDGSVTLLCSPRPAGAKPFTVTSTDGGDSFIPGGKSVLGAQPVGAIGASTAQNLLVANGHLNLSIDGGQTWGDLDALLILRPGTLPGDATWLGFESATVGRAFSETDRQTIWSTHDGGHTWTTYAFS